LAAIAALLAPACSVYLDESLLTRDADSGAPSPVSPSDAAAAPNEATDAIAPDVVDAGAQVDAAMSVTSLDPSSITLGAGDTPLTVIGSRFAAGSVVQFDGADLVTAFSSATELKATIPASALESVGTFSVV